MNAAFLGVVASKAGPPPTISVAPASFVTDSTTDFSSIANFTATFTGGTPSSIVWSIESESNASADVVAGQGTGTVTIQITTNDSGGIEADGSCTVRCTAVIGGVTYSATAYREHDFYYFNGGPGR